MRKKALITASLLLPAAMAFSAGYQINVQGIRQIAMGGSGTAMPWDASTIFYNPGGLSRLNTLQAYGSVQFLIVNTSYVQTPTQGYSENSKTGVYTPFNIYVGGPLKKDSRIGVGLGIYTPFGSGLTWNDDWEGKFVTQSIKLQSFFIQPTASYELSEAVSVGAGFVYALGNVALNKAIPLQNMNGMDGQAELKGNASGIGYNFGIQIKATEQLQFGISYRSKVTMKVKDGDVNFTIPSSVSTNFPNTSFTSELPLPGVASVGVAFSPTEQLTIQADVNYINWKAYDTLRFDYEQNTPALTDTKAPRNYKNTVSFRLGANYRFSERFALMAGGAYDPSPVANGFVSPDLPDANHWIASAGLSFRAAERLNILAALEYNTTVKRDAQYTPDNFNGKYQTKAVVPAIGITYDF